MKEPFETIGKKLPYHETEEYLNGLIDKATEQAISRQSSTKSRRHTGLMMVATAAAVALIIGVGVTLHHHGSWHTTALHPSDSPLDEFLSTLSDEEAAQLTYYEIEEIPEYYSIN